MRRYHEPISVRLDDAPGGALSCPVRQFVWRRRRWQVTCAETSWVESAPWWLGPEVRAVRGDHASDEPVGDRDLLGEREVWRVQADCGHGESVFELVHALGDASWTLRAVVD